MLWPILLIGLFVFLVVWFSWKYIKKTSDAEPTANPSAARPANAGSTSEPGRPATGERPANAGRAGGERPARAGRTPDEERV